MRVIHDFGFNFGGAERVTRELVRLPGVERLILLSGSDEVLDEMSGTETSLLYPEDTASNYRQKALLRALFGRFDRVRHDGDVLCSSYAFAHWMPCEGRKYVYCHSPLRQIWTAWPETKRQLGVAGGLGAPFVGRLRQKDVAAARQAHMYIATSRAVRSRIARFYDLPMEQVPIVRPPVDDSYFFASDTAREDFFLFAGRLVEPYKRVALILDAFRGSPFRLVIAGDGRDRVQLESVAPPNVTFLGPVGSSELAVLMRRARGLIFPSLDDYGMVPAEAIACGTPVLAYKGGGALDTVIEGVSGAFFDVASVDSLKSGLASFAAKDWDHGAISSAGREFGKSRFRSELRRLLEL